METFVVRIWMPSPELTEEVPPDELRGHVEHIGSSERTQFRNADDLLEILRAALEPSEEAQRPERFKQT